MMRPALEVMVVADVICPWCYVGKRRLEKALALMGGAAISVRWLPFELNPDMPKEGMARRDYRVRKFGSWERSQAMDAQLMELGRQEGLAFHYDVMQRTPNTFQAHRLIWRAAMEGLQDAIVEALFAAYFSQGRDVGDDETLADIAQGSGMDREDVMRFLAGDGYAREVRATEDEARRAGITGVPAFIANGRPLLMGAQPAEVLASAFHEVLKQPAPAAG
jgi:predicted DsbA family dithiol-disulfide isomerase